MSEIDPYAAPPQDDPPPFDLDAWIDGAALAQRSVVIYGRPDLISEMERVKRALEALPAEADEALGGSTRADLDAEGDALVEQMESSKSTWTLRALSPTEIDALPPLPDLVKALPEKHTPEQAAEHARRVREWETAWDARNTATVAAATVRVESANGGAADSVTVEQVERLKERIGKAQITRLIQAATRATVEEPEIPAPFSRRSSRNAPT